MKSGTRKVLEANGWNTIVFKFPATAIDFVNALEPPKSTQESKEDLAKLKCLEDSVVAYVLAIADLPDDIRFSIDLWSASDEDRERGQFEVLNKAVSAALLMTDGVRITRSSLEADIGKGKRGRPPLLHHRQIANAFADVFFLGTGKLPAIGKDYATHKANGRFQKSLEEIFRSEGLPDAQPTSINNISREAKERFTDLYQAKLLEKNDKTKHRWRSSQVSLITGKRSRGMSLFEIDAFQKIYSKK